MWTASFQIVERQLPSHLDPPSAPAGTTSEVDLDQQDFDAVVVKIDWQADAPQWRLNGAQVSSLEMVRDRLTIIAGIRQEISVIIDPTAAVPLEHVIRAYDTGRSIGFSDIRFATTD